MANDNLGYIFGIILLLAAPLYIARLIAIKTNRDPIMRKYRPGTPAYAAFQKLQDPRRFAISVIISVIVMLAAAGFAVYEARAILHSHASSPHYILISNTIAAIAAFALALVVGYYVLIRKR